MDDDAADYMDVIGLDFYAASATCKHWHLRDAAHTLG
jgi:hypothetical protein